MGYLDTMNTHLIVFRPLSPWQKDDCINRSAEYDCPNEATQEAFLGNDYVFNAVRCCSDTRCMQRAAQRAQAGFDGLRGRPVKSS